MGILRGVLNNDEVLFFPGHTKERKRSRALWVSKVENMPGHSHYRRGIQEPAQETLKWIAESPFAKNLKEIKNRSVTRLEKMPDGYFKITDNQEETYFAKFLLLCTGVMDIQPEIKGSIRSILPFANKQTAEYCLRCDGHHVMGKKTGVIGHGMGAAWVAIMLYERYHPPEMHLFWHGQKPEKEYSDEVKELLKLYGIKIHPEEIIEIKGGPRQGKLEGLILNNNQEIPLEMTFVSLGMIVYNQLAKQLKAELDSRGFVITNELGESSVSGLFVAGDLRAKAKKQIYTAWDHAVDSMDEINRRLRAEKRETLRQAKSLEA